MKIILFAPIGLVALSIMACSQEGNSPKTQIPKDMAQKVKFHGDMKTVAPPTVVEALKKNHLELSSSRTIGEVFDSYRHATKKEWRETRSSNGPMYVDYIASFDVPSTDPALAREGVAKRKLEIKFVIREDGETYIAVASRFDIKKDGSFTTTRYYPKDVKRIVTAIYENQEIAF